MRNDTRQEDGERELLQLPAGSVCCDGAYAESFNCCSILSFLCLTGNIQQAQGCASYRAPLPAMNELLGGCPEQGLVLQVSLPLPGTSCDRCLGRVPRGASSPVFATGT